MKQTLLDKVNVFLLRQGYTIKNLTRTSFDILARKNEHILLIKVLEDANSITRQYTEDMISVSSYINASPLIISDKAGDLLEDNIVYSRFGIYTLNFKTFINCVDNKFPFIKRSQAGLTASIVGEKLKEKREELGYSLNSLSKKLGVTSRMVLKYENENSEITVNRAKKLYDLFGHHVFNEVNVFNHEENPKIKFKTRVSKKYNSLGFDVAETKKMPFDIMAKKENELILTEISDKVNPNMQSLSRLLDADNLVIFSKKKPKNIPSMTKKEFMDFEEANELVRFLKEY
jgi:putative transcriptional regulator